MTIETVSQAAEAFLFTYLGIALFSIDYSFTSAAFVTILVLITIAARIAAVAICMGLMWLIKRKNGLGLKFNDICFITFGGLTKGAVSIALAF